MENYYNAFTEVDTILDYLVEEDYNKIPEDIIEVIRENKNEDYIFEYDEEVELKDQELMKETRAILYNLFRDYLATPVQREKIKKWQQEERVKAEQKKKDEFQYKELFPIKKIEIDENLVQENKELIEYKESNFFTRIKNWFSKLLKNMKK